jgi:FecR protein
MAGDNKRNARPGGDELLDWFTISYRTLYIVGGLLVAAAAAAGYYYFVRGRTADPGVVARPIAAPQMAAARFTSLEGNIKVKAVGTVEWITADKALVLGKGDRIKTGSGSTAEITFFDGTLVHVRPDSIIMVEETSENPTTKERRVAWNISSGEVFFNTSNKNVEGSRTDITTPLTRLSAVDEAKGNVKVDDSGAGDIRIFTAVKPVQVETKGGEKLALTSNEGVKVDVDGKAEAKMALPGTPVLQAPPNQTDISYPDPQHATTLLAWRPVTGAAAYHFQIDYSASFNRPIKDMPSWKDNSLELRGLDVGRYYWRVAAVDKQNVEGSFSDFSRFSVTRPSGGSVAGPPLTIETFDLRTNILQVKGRTEPGATVSVNSQPLDVQADGSFNEFISLDKGGTQDVVVRAVGVNGGVSTQHKTVTVAF